LPYFQSPQVADLARIDQNLDYSPIPIKKLVEVQYGAMLAVLNTPRLAIGSPA
jgi:hypothetical protein